MTKKSIASHTVFFILCACLIVDVYLDLANRKELDRTKAQLLEANSGLDACTKEKQGIQEKYDNLRRNVILEQCEWLTTQDADGEPMMRRPKTPEEKAITKTLSEMTLKQFPEKPSLYPAPQK